MAKSNKKERRHRGFVFVDTDDGPNIAFLEPHYNSECSQKCEEAAQTIRDHKTVYEAPDANTARVSVGYNRTYADRYKTTFGQN